MLASVLCNVSCGRFCLSKLYGQAAGGLPSGWRRGSDARIIVRTELTPETDKLKYNRVHVHSFFLRPLPHDRGEKESTSGQALTLAENLMSSCR